jgi:hypothetical protein
LRGAGCGYQEARDAYQRAEAKLNEPDATRTRRASQRYANEANAAKAAKEKAAECEQRARDQWDLAAQWEAAVAARNAARVAANQRFWSMAEFVLLFGAFAAALYAAVQARRAADTAERDLIERDRPQLSFVIDKKARHGDLLDSLSNENFSVFTVTIKNVGGGAADLEFHHATVLAAANPPMPSAQAFKFILAQGEKRVLERGDTHTFSGFGRLSDDEKKKVLSLTDGLSAYVYGYVAFTDMQSNTKWEAGFCYRAGLILAQYSPDAAFVPEDVIFDRAGGDVANFERRRQSPKEGDNL